MTDWSWLVPYSEFLSNESFQSLVRFIAALMTAALSLITFYLKLQDRKENAPAKLAVSEVSWDVASKFPIFPLPNSSKFALFPFVASDLSTRVRSETGWSTVTELRIWNAGKGIIFGPLVKRTSVAQVCIPTTVGDYEIRWSISNDPELRFHLSRLTRDISTAEDRIQISFDFMRAGKGILISIWHNSADGEGICIRAFSEQTPSSIHGSSHVFRVPFAKLMSRQTDFLLIPNAIMTIFLFYVGNIWLAIAFAIFTWAFALTAYMQRKLVLSPDDLRVGTHSP